MIADGDGRFRRDGIPEGTCVVRYAGLSRRPVGIRGDTEVLLDFDTVPLTGQVLSAADGAPVAGAEIRLTPAPGQDGKPSPPRVTTDAAGRFAMRVEAGFRWALTVTATGFYHYRRDVEIEVPGADLELSIPPS